MSANPYPFGIRPTHPFSTQPAGIGSKSAFGMIPASRQPALGAGARILMGLGMAAVERRAFSLDERIQVWCKGQRTHSLDLADWRYDEFGNLISWNQYGHANSQWGWEIDHVQPLALGGTNDISNLRPLHCSTNRSLGGLLGAAVR